jgi:hypothetical protein
MNLFEMDKISTPLMSISFRKSETVEVDDVNALATDYKTIKVTETANKTAIKSALEAGAAIKGCSIVEHKHIQFK